MLNYLEKKKAELEESKVEPSVVYADIDCMVEQYRKELYTARDAEIEKKNMLIDAQIEILAEAIEEAERMASDTDETIGEETEEKEVDA